MSMSEKEKDQLFHPARGDEDEGIPGPMPDAGMEYFSRLGEDGQVHLYDASGVEIDLEREPSYEDPVSAVDDGLSPAQRQWIAGWERQKERQQADEEPPEPDYLQEIRDFKIQCDNCHKVESLETKVCLGGAKDDETDEIYAVFNCGCGHTENFPAEALPPRYLERAAQDESAIEEVIHEILRKRELGLD